MENNPIITIETPFTKASVPLSELNPQERASLAQLLGISGARRDAFLELRKIPKFRKLQHEDVWNACPKGPTRFDVEIEVILNNDSPAGRAACKRITDLVPEAQCSAAYHRAYGWCPKCEQEHSISRHSVLVKLDVQGVPLSNLYGI